MHRVIELWGRVSKLCAQGCSLFWVVTHRILVVVYRRFGAACWSHLGGLGRAVNRYQQTRINPEEPRPHAQRGGNHKFARCLILRTI